MASRIKELFLCTGNCCRSQMAETLLRQIGGDRFESLSAGSHPAGHIHALAELAMERMGFATAGQRSKSWDEFADAQVDVVITLCDSAANEPCPIWPGAPLTVHWPHPDPAGLMGDEDERIAAAVRVAATLRRKIEKLVALDFARTDRGELRERIQDLRRD